MFTFTTRYEQDLALHHRAMQRGDRVLRSECVITLRLAQILGALLLIPLFL